MFSYNNDHINSSSKNNYYSKTVRRSMRFASEWMSNRPRQLKKQQFSK